jgi:hypothetical protein
MMARSHRGVVMASNQFVVFEVCNVAWHAAQSVIRFSSESDPE